MKRKPSRRRRPTDVDTMRREYDFSGGLRGVTSARYRQGSNLVAVDPDLLDVFPDGKSVNEALRALAGVIRSGRGKRSA